jgi:SAM-dependent methyltransferase
MCPVCSGVDVRTLDLPSGRGLRRCRDCRLLFAPDVLADRTPSARLSDEDRRREERVAERRAPYFARLLRAAGRPGRLLDVGAGGGAFVSLAREAGWDAVGVDVDPAVVAYARAGGLDVRVGELPALELPGKSFDVVTLCNVLDFMPRPVTMLRECARLLVPGGRILVRTPNASWQLFGARLTRALRALGLRRLFEGRQHLLSILTVSNFSARTLRVALERTGYVGVIVRNSPPIAGDPYLDLGRFGERALSVGKRAVFGSAQTVALVSGQRWLVGPSIEAWARRAA